MKINRLQTDKALNLPQEIRQQIHQMDKMNRQLLTISDQVQNTSFMKNKQKISSRNLAFQFQNQIRNTLQGVIQNIKQFYLDIDKKLKNFAIVMSNQMNDKNNQDFRYNVLFDKVKSLQNTLKKTQDNQTKLLHIIQTMMQKYQITQQPTILRNQPLIRNRQNTISHQDLVSGSKRLNSPLLTQNPKMQRSIHQNLYIIDQSIVRPSPTMNLYLNNTIQRQQQQEIFIKKLYSKSSVPIEQKKSLKSDNKNFNICGNVGKNSYFKQNTTNTKQSSMFEDQRHRLNFMMDKLKK